MPEPLSLSDPLENLHLKDKSQEELWRMLIGREIWNGYERHMLSAAYDTAAQLHAEDKHRGQPYIYHLLRVANRLNGYLHIQDVEVVAASLLHDSVEDHAGDLSHSAATNPIQLRDAALDTLKRSFSPRTAELVAAVTNLPDTGEELSDEEKLARYASKVKQAIKDPQAWLIKFCDWVDNAVGITHGANQLTNQQISWFQHKYGGEVLAALEERFNMPDIQQLLDASAKGYVIAQFELAHQRLMDNQAIANERHHKKNPILRAILPTEDD